MPRPKKQRLCCYRPDCCYFKPRGVPLGKLEEVVLEMDEVEAVKLYDIDGLEQLKAAKKMGISQPTFARIIGRARGKIAKALIFGKAIRIKELYC